MITLKRFRRIEAALWASGYDYASTQPPTLNPPRSAEAFAAKAIYVICNSGMRVTVAQPIHRRCMSALRQGASASTVFGHPGKVVAIDEIWANRTALFRRYRDCEDKLEFCQKLPWIGPITKGHLAKNLGVDTIKEDRHLQRLADFEGSTALQMCQRIARQTGYRLATIDSILWRACADGILNSMRYQFEGWRGSFHPGPLDKLPIEVVRAADELAADEKQT